MSKKRIFLSSPHMGGFEKQYIKEAFDSNWIAPLGKNVDLFEKEVCEYVGIKAGVAMVSGTSAIHMALKCVGLKPGDRVFCSSLTFAGSCNPIIYEQGIPVFIDAEPESWNIFYSAVLKNVLSIFLISAISYGIKLIIPANSWANFILLAGLCAFLGAISNLFVILRKDDRQYLKNYLFPSSKVKIEGCSFLKKYIKK